MAHDVSNAGRIVGAAYNGSTTRPFVAERGAQPVDLGTLAGTSTSSGRAWAVNDRGDIAGVSRNENDIASQATLWPKGRPGSPVNLGPIDGARFSQAYAINNQQ